MDEPARPGTKQAGVVIAILSLAMLTGLIVWTGTPDVNEAHYLCKARHFWNRHWCHNDLFVSSHEAHWLFYACAGWPTCWISLATTAWLGRIAGWLLISWGLLRLTGVFGFRLGTSLVLVPMMICLNRNFHLAGEWFAGGFEAKSIAWGFVFGGLACWLARQPKRACLFLATACGFHIVIGLWTGIALALAGGASRAAAVMRPGAGPVLKRGAAPRDPLTLPVLVMSGMLLVVGLWPALARNPDSPPQVVQQANELQAFSRLAHHQDATRFLPERWTGFLGLTAVWMILVRSMRPRATTTWMRFNLLVAASLGLDLAGSLISWSAHAWPVTRPLAAQLLVLYWFRLADVLVPIAVVINGALFIERLLPQRAMRWALATGMALVIGAVAWNSWAHWRDPRSGSTNKPQRCCGHPCLCHARSRPSATG